jgi:hypothetical protein
VRACQTLVPGPAGIDAITTTVVDFVQPAVGITVNVSVYNNQMFADGQYVWVQGGGFYKVTDVYNDGETSYLTLQNLYTTPHNVIPGTTVTAAALVAPSGVPEAAGSVGPAGNDGADGTSSYLYVAYATDSLGASFSNTPFGGATHVAIRRSDTAIPSPVASDFTGLWVQFRGTDGAEGNGPEPARMWEWKTNGTFKWVCPSGYTQMRIRVTGGGGGGGGGGATGSGRGGGGGEYATFVLTPASGGTYTIAVGGGGTGGVDTGNGGNGSSSSVTMPDTSSVSANGGGGGGSSNAGALGTGGAGGTGTAELRVSGSPGGNGVTGYETSGGDAGRQGTGGLADGEGGSPGGGGGGATAIAGTGANGATGSVRIDMLPA